MTIIINTMILIFCELICSKKSVSSILCSAQQKSGVGMDGGSGHSSKWSTFIIWKKYLALKKCQNGGGGEVNIHE